MRNNLRDHSLLTTDLYLHDPPERGSLPDCPTAAGEFRRCDAPELYRSEVCIFVSCWAALLPNQHMVAGA